ncbi:MAG: response regulator transcription factor [Paludibacteraceae bacterium]|nr:response regulator transcription factor [Paludibacteraceae bacterium]
MISIIIADDHKMVAQALKQVIEAKDTAEVTGIALTIADAAGQLEEKKPDLLLLDIAMPDGDGIEALPKLRKASQDTKIIILTMYSEAEVIQRAIKSGVDGYLMKDSDAEEILAAIEHVSKGEKYISPAAASKAAALTETIPQLTPREREVLKLIVEGKSSREAAKVLYLGFETVRSYTKYLRQKLGVKNTAGMVEKAIRLHLV